MLALCPFRKLKWQISLPFRMLQQVKSLPFHIHEAWKTNCGDQQQYILKNLYHKIVLNSYKKKLVIKQSFI